LRIRNWEDVKYFFKNAYYAIKFEDFHFYSWKKSSKFGIYALYYDGFHFVFDLKFCVFGWWSSSSLSED